MSFASSIVMKEDLSEFLEEPLIRNTITDIARKIELSKIIESYQTKYDSQLLSIAMDKEGEVPIIPHHYLFIPPEESVSELSKHFRDDYVKDVLTLEQSARQIDENSTDDISTIISSLPKEIQLVLESFDDYISKEVYQPFKAVDVNVQTTEPLQPEVVKSPPPVTETKKKAVPLKKDPDTMVSVTSPPPPPLPSKKRSKAPPVEKKIEPPIVVKPVKTASRGGTKLNRSYVQPVQVLQAIIEKLTATGIQFVNVENKIITYEAIMKQKKIKYENTIYSQAEESVETISSPLEIDSKPPPKSILPSSLLTYLTINSSRGNLEEEDDDKPSRAASMVAEDYMEEMKIKLDEFDSKWIQLGVAATDTLKKKWELQSMLRVTLESLPKHIIDDVPLCSDHIVNPFLGMAEGGNGCNNSNSNSNSNSSNWSWLSSLLPTTTTSCGIPSNTTAITTTTTTAAVTILGDLTTSTSITSGGDELAQRYQDSDAIMNHSEMMDSKIEEQKETNGVMDIAPSAVSNSIDKGIGHTDEISPPPLEVDSVVVVTSEEEAAAVDAIVEEAVETEVIVAVAERVTMKATETEITEVLEGEESTIDLKHSIAESKIEEDDPVDASRSDSFSNTDPYHTTTNNLDNSPFDNTSMKHALSSYALNDGRKVTIHDGVTTITESVSEQYNPTLPFDNDSEKMAPDDSYNYCLEKMVGLLMQGFHSILVDKVQTTVGDSRRPDHRHRASMMCDIIKNQIIPKSMTVTNTNSGGSNKSNIVGYRQLKGSTGKRKNYGDPWGPVLILCKLSELYLWEEILDTVFRDPSSKATIQCTSYYGCEEDRAIIRQFWTLDGLYTARANSHVILTNYETFFEDYNKLSEIYWQAIVMDEPWGLLSNRKFFTLKTSLLTMNTRHRIISCSSLSTFPGTYLPDLKEALAVIFPIALKVISKEYQMENEESLDDVEEIDFKSMKLLKSLLASFTCVYDPRVTYDYKDSLFTTRGALMDSLSWFEWYGVRLSTSSLRSSLSSRQTYSDNIYSSLSHHKLEVAIKEEDQMSGYNSAGTMVATSIAIPFQEFHYKFKYPEYTDTMGDWEIDFELRMLPLEKKDFNDTVIRRPGRPKWKNIEQPPPPRDGSEEHFIVPPPPPPPLAPSSKGRGKPGRKPKSWYEAQAMERNTTEKMELDETCLPSMFRDGNEEESLAEGSELGDSVLDGEDTKGDKKQGTLAPTRMKRAPVPTYDSTSKRPRRECISKEGGKNNNANDSTAIDTTTHSITERGERWLVEVLARGNVQGGSKYRFLGTYATEEDAWKVYHASHMSPEDLCNPALGSYKKGKGRPKVLPSVDEISDEDLASAVRVLSAPIQAASTSVGEWHSPLAIPTAHAKLLGDNFTAYIISSKTMLGRAETKTLEFANTLGLSDISGLSCGSVDVHLSADRSIAEQHASILWDFDLGLFYMKCITPLADIYVDGVAVTCEEDAVPLNHSTVIQIGCRIFYFLLSSGWTTRPNVLSPLLQRKYTWQSVGQTVTIRDMNSRLDETFDLIDEQRQLHQVIFKPPPFSVASVGVGGGSGAGRAYSHQASGSTVDYSEENDLDRLYDSAKDHFLLAAANNVKQQQQILQQQHHHHHHQPQRKRKKLTGEESYAIEDAKRRLIEGGRGLETKTEIMNPMECDADEGVVEEEEEEDDTIQETETDDGSVEYLGDNNTTIPQPQLTNNTNIDTHSISNSREASSSSSSSSPFFHQEYDNRITSTTTNPDNSLRDTLPLTDLTDVGVRREVESTSQPYQAVSQVLGYQTVAPLALPLPHSLSNSDIIYYESESESVVSNEISNPFPTTTATTTTSILGDRHYTINISNTNIGTNSNNHTYESISHPPPPPLPHSHSSNSIITHTTTTTIHSSSNTNNLKEKEFNQSTGSNNNNNDNTAMMSSPAVHTTTTVTKVKEMSDVFVVETPMTTNTSPLLPLPLPPPLTITTTFDKDKSQQVVDSIQNLQNPNQQPFPQSLFNSSNSNNVSNHLPLSPVTFHSSQSGGNSGNGSIVSSSMAAATATAFHSILSSGSSSSSGRTSLPLHDTTATLQHLIFLEQQKQKQQQQQYQQQQHIQLLQQQYQQQQQQQQQMQYQQQHTQYQQQLQLQKQQQQQLLQQQLLQQQLHQSLSYAHPDTNNPMVIEELTRRQYSSPTSIPPVRGTGHNPHPIQMTSSTPSPAAYYNIVNPYYTDGNISSNQPLSIPATYPDPSQHYRSPVYVSEPNYGNQTAVNIGSGSGGGSSNLTVQRSPTVTITLPSSVHYSDRTETQLRGSGDTAGNRDNNNNNIHQHSSKDCNQSDSS